MLAQVPFRPGLSILRVQAETLISHDASSSFKHASPFSQQSSRGLKIMAILYKGGQAAKEEPRLLGTVENEVSGTPSR